jgi:hypothetical protein
LFITKQVCVIVYYFLDQFQNWESETRNYYWCYQHMYENMHYYRKHVLKSIFSYITWNLQMVKIWPLKKVKITLLSTAYIILSKCLFISRHPWQVNFGDPKVDFQTLVVCGKAHLLGLNDQIKCFDHTRIILNCIKIPQH